MNLRLRTPIFRRPVELTIGWYETAEQAGWRADHMGTGHPAWRVHIVRGGITPRTRGRGWRVVNRRDA